MDKDHIDYERSERSVFVGNIPYEATEDQLKDIFNEVGSVVSFRLVFDRESGKPKGYGFAEYQDQETAMSAMRNLNGRELHGRPLRVDNATSEKNRSTFTEESSTFKISSGPPIESDYGEPCNPDDAPEAISKAVASLPPEQMYELMSKMKQCIQNNPVEARTILLQNPQLAFALLQAQVVMRIVDPAIAMKMIHRKYSNPSTTTSNAEKLTPELVKDIKPTVNFDNLPMRPPVESMDTGASPNRSNFVPPSLRGDIGIGTPLVGVEGPSRSHFEPHRNDAGRSSSPERFARAAVVDFNPRINRSDQRPTDPRSAVTSRPRDMPAINRFPGQEATIPQDPRRAANSLQNVPQIIPKPQQGVEEDEEKANLIMQVLQLTPEQIQLLPEDQRNNIVALKSQFGLN